MNKHIVFLLVLVAGLLLGSVALAAGQTGIGWDVIAGGGGSGSAGNVAIDDTIGQPIIGLAQAGDVIVESGFWPGFAPAPTTTPTDTPTPTPTSISTHTPTPTSPPGATHTPTPTLTPTRAPVHSIYLPLLRK